jgi:hypothetical protein
MVKAQALYMRRARGEGQCSYLGRSRHSPERVTLGRNVLLDEVDKELEKREHTFVRYADDCNVYVIDELRSYLGVEGVLRPNGDARHVRGPGQVDTPTPASAATQTVEAWTKGLPGGASAGMLRARRHDCRRTPRPLVETRRQRDARCAAKPPLRRARATETRRVTSTLRTARCGPACRVVWQGSPRDCLGSPMPIGLRSRQLRWDLVRSNAELDSPRRSTSLEREDTDSRVRRSQPSNVLRISGRDHGLVELQSG